MVTAASLPPEGGSALQTAMRGRPEWKGIPILALGDSDAEVKALSAAHLFEDCQTKFDREAMLTSLTRLSAALGGEVLSNGSLALPEPVLVSGREA